MSKILVIDDDIEIRKYLKSSLSSQGFQVSTLEGGDAVLEHLAMDCPDLILLDQNLPGKTGLEILRQIRVSQQHQLVPVIFITGRDEEPYKVAALESGADDYVVKPISPKEIEARIKAVLRRAQPEAMGSEVAMSSPKCLNIGRVTVDFQAHQVFVEEEEVYLTLTEFRLLSELVKNMGKVLSRDVLRGTALGNLNVTDRTIDVHVASLRKKIKNQANSIQTVRGVGYRFSAAETPAAALS